MHMKRIVFTLMAILLCCPGVAQKYGDLFRSDDLLEVALTANYGKFLQDRGQDPSYHDAVLKYKDEAGRDVSLKVEIRARGHYRRDPFVCAFPPYRMRFPKKETLPALFEGQDKLKVVAHCSEEGYILREYLIYKAYNLLTPQSFRVRLMRIRYVDSEKQVPESVHFAFFIESEEEMAARNGALPVDDETPMSEAQVDRQALTRVYLFNYMIANRDFDLEVKQNLKIIEPSGKPPIAVPYDFDWSGMVDASYTQSSIGEPTSFYDRQKMRPLCRTQAEYEQVIALLQAVEDRIYLLYEENPWLPERDKRECIKYYKSFYKSCGQPSFIQKELMPACKN